jgi:UDP-2,3-diacylglucosamine pyrophosphatase LpxH
MAQDRDATFTRLNDLWQKHKGDPLSLDELKKIAVLSDLHLGDGSKADDLRRNTDILVKALRFYREQGYHLFLLGDIEELWQFSVGSIEKRYRESVYKELSSFSEDRIHRAWGNHDDYWGRGVPGVKGCPEAIALSVGNEGARALFVHGHQGSTESDRDSRFSRVWVRAFRPVEIALRTVGLYRNPSLPKSIVVKEYERIMYEWAKTVHCLLVCGHSHRAMCVSQPYAEILRDTIDTLEKKTERTPEDAARVALDKEKSRGRDIGRLDPAVAKPIPCYFNSGCGLYTEGITALEIENDIRLVYWQRELKEPRLLQKSQPIRELLQSI